MPATTRCYFCVGLPCGSDHCRFAARPGRGPPEPTQPRALRKGTLTAGHHRRRGTSRATRTMPTRVAERHPAADRGQPVTSRSRHARIVRRFAPFAKKELDGCSTDICPFSGERESCSVRRNPPKFLSLFRIHSRPTGVSAGQTGCRYATAGQSTDLSTTCAQSIHGHPQPVHSFVPRVWLPGLQGGSNVTGVLLSAAVPGAASEGPAPGVRRDLHTNCQRSLAG